MSLVLQSSGGGQITLQEPATASNFTQTLPAATGSVALLDGSNNFSVAGNLSFNSGFGSAGVAYGCRAWVNFDGTGTPAIRASGNVSSITDNGVGSYTVNFTTTMPDANYSVSLAGRFLIDGSTNGRWVIGNASNGMQTTSVSLFCTNVADSAALDPVTLCVAVFR